MTDPRIIVAPTKKNKALFIAGTCEECNAIINRLVAEEPDMTIKEYLEKHQKEILILR